MTDSWFLIVNPTAGKGNFSKQWKTIKHTLEFTGITFSFAFTAYAKHEIKLAQNAIKQGFKNIVSVGGDGTLHHIVNGIMRQRYEKATNINIAVIPVGTGNDWIKTYGISKNIKKAIANITAKKTVLQDIGFLETTNTTTYFNNLAGLGYDGYVVKKGTSLKRFGAIGYLLAGIAGLLFYKPTPLKIEATEEKIKAHCLMVLFGIGKFSGGGMQLTKYTNSSNGLFDVTVIKNITFFNLLMHLPKLYNGKITTHKKVTYFTSKALKITCNSPKKPFIEADGELIDVGDVKISIVKKAVRFVVS